MKIPYAIIHVNWDGMETFKVVPFERINHHGKQFIYQDVWMIPGDNARSRSISTPELIALAEKMGRRISFHAAEDASRGGFTMVNKEVQDEHVGV